MNILEDILKAHQDRFSSLVPIDLKKETYYIFDFSTQNKDLEAFNLSDVEKMTQYVFETLAQHHAKVGVGGYNEERAVYQKSKVFDNEGGSRSIHLGIDIWMPAFTPLFAPLKAKVHSFQNNDNFGDYGPTIILEHQLENQTFYTLYGHLSLSSLDDLEEGKEIAQGEKIGEIGPPEVNGNWTPHLHFQVMKDMLNKKGDFIGVAPKSARAYYLDICPNPNLILGLPDLD